MSSPDVHRPLLDHTGHPAATSEQLLAAVLPHRLRDLADQTFLSPLHHPAQTLSVPDLLRAVITADQIRRLFTLWACLRLSDAHEIHEWYLTRFEFVSTSPNGSTDLEVERLAEAAANDYTGLHACVFPDGDVSFYLDHCNAGPVFASSVMSLSQFGSLGPR